MIKSHFTSRYPNGVVIEADWTALEIVKWAFLNKDPVLRKLILSGEDMHRFIGGRVLGCKPEDITDEQRSKLKPANFTLIYGGTDWNLVTKDGLEPEFAKQVYDTFWNTFPVARLYADNLMFTLDANAEPVDDQGNMISHYSGITDRKFYFKNYPEKISKFCFDNRIYSKKGFKFSEGMNYKIQSFATADTHMIALGLLFREAIKHRDKFLLVNTVHDSVLIDCRPEYVRKCCLLVKNSMESVVGRLKERFNIDFDLPLKIEIKVGSSWADMKKYNFDEVTNA